jgi:hypothetical protein
MASTPLLDCYQDHFKQTWTLAQETTVIPTARDRKDGGFDKALESRFP